MNMYCMSEQTLRVCDRWRTNTNVCVCVKRLIRPVNHPGWVSLWGRDKNRLTSGKSELGNKVLQMRGLEKKIIVTMFVLHFDHGSSASWAILLPHAVLHFYLISHRLLGGMGYIKIVKWMPCFIDVHHIMWELIDMSLLWLHSFFNPTIQEYILVLKYCVNQKYREV